jgi:hypothetical protein
MKAVRKTPTVAIVGHGLPRHLEADFKAAASPGSIV